MLHQTYREDRMMAEAHHHNKQCNVSYKQQCYAASNMTEKTNRFYTD